ncbi:GlcNAc-binding protein A precursor [Oerskovia enterophila]|uniref:GlcNAc-binding protein A n=2 Tax=Cellulomonadaceae TaxID=85016 RepID=A0A163PUU8_9CELL|nr:GlcNAc-binding protein A precursor [Oerskovia enterophila]
MESEKRNMRRLRAAMIAAVLGVAAIAAPIIVAPSASAHGWITSPPSRQDNCATGAVSFSCGGVQYEPQSVEAPKGSMQCSGGSGFTVLDDNSKAWPRKSVGSTVTFQWKLTAAHNTSTWEYFVDGKLHQTFSQGGAQPPSNISHTLTNLPAGNHTVLARWNVSNTVNAFYNCVDISVGGDPTGNPTGGDPTGGNPTGGDPTGTTGGTTGNGTCTDPAWSAGSVYTGGARVSYNNTKYEAKWWTTGENPGTSGQWGVWKNLGAC